MSFLPDKIPTDILRCIFALLSDRRDLHAAALVTRTCNTVVTPLLYRRLDGIISKGRMFHPATTILNRPELAQFVRHVNETGAIHGVPHNEHPNITADALRALRLCTGLESMTWNDDSVGFATDTTFLLFLRVLKNLPIKEITVRSYSDLGEEVWEQLRQMTGFRKIAIWSMEGPPRVLQGWSDKLGDTLTHLELGRCAGVPPTILMSVLSKVPLLRELRLRGVPAAAIPTILGYLPELQTLDTEFIGPGIYRPPSMPLPRLRNLTVRTSAMDRVGPQKLWIWIRQLLPYPSLEYFTLNSFAVLGHTDVPRGFIMNLANTHMHTLKMFVVNMTQLTLGEINCLCQTCPNLETLTCSVANSDINAIRQATADGRNLRSLHIQWNSDLTSRSWNGGLNTNKIWRKKYLSEFTEKDAEDLMLSNNSRIRTIGMGRDVFTGKWVLKPNPDGTGTSDLVFEVKKDIDATQE